jgi:molybdopterin molybdotransferase
MAEFLKLVPPAQAWEALYRSLPPFEVEVEEIAVRQALGRVTARPVTASEPLPAFSRSSMDGYAVRANDTYGASDGLPVYLKVVGEAPMGAAPAFRVAPGQAALIHTGGMLPEGADAVVMVEQTQVLHTGEVEVYRAVAVGENVLSKGEDVIPGQEVILAGTRLRPAEIGGLLALGQVRVAVAKRPRIGILSTGDEVVPPETSPQPGQVRDINTYTLSALIEQAGGEAVSYGILPDRVEILQQVLHQALNECQAALITAGSSASTRDLTAEAIQAQGKPGVLVHGINIRPGKPTILAVCNGKVVIGLPGNPVSALVIAGLFVTPVIYTLCGLKRTFQPSLTARLAVNLPSQAGREEWIPVRLESSGEEVAADPIFFKSNLIFNLARADGLVQVPADANGLGAGERVKVVLF